MLKTSHDLARVMGQSDETARRVLREVFPRDGDVNFWRLDDEMWYVVLHHLVYNRERKYGQIKPRKKQFTLNMTELGLF